MFHNEIPIESTETFCFLFPGRNILNMIQEDSYKGIPVEKYVQLDSAFGVHLPRNRPLKQCFLTRAYKTLITYTVWETTENREWTEANESVSEDCLGFPAATSFLLLCLTLRWSLQLWGARASDKIPGACPCARWLTRQPSWNARTRALSPRLVS